MESKDTKKFENCHEYNDIRECKTRECIKKIDSDKARTKKKTMTSCERVLILLS